MPNLSQTTKLPALPARPADAHKGTFGTTIIVGGCSTMIGAPALTAAAALRSGVGLVKIATHKQIIPAVLTIEPSATAIELDDPPNRLNEQLDLADPDRKAIVAVGPGLGQSSDAGTIVKQLFPLKRPTILDADGLNLIAQSPDLIYRATERPLILTPHPGEFARLAKNLDIGESPVDPATRPVAAAKLANAYKAIVVLKGQHTIVTDGKQYFVNQTGNPALATAGSGDILTGIIAALLAQNLAPLDAAVLAVHVHGLAADLWTQYHGPTGLTAMTLATLIPDAFQKLRKS